MDRLDSLDAIIARYDLNEHPFYRDWACGSLPIDKMRRYGSDYRGFVSTVAGAWDTLGFPDYACEERFHEQLWARFRSGIGSEDVEPSAQTAALVSCADTLFADPATAAGGLYAFEAQQPRTAQTKYSGLLEHYKLDAETAEYFRVHAGDFAEAQALRKLIKQMPSDKAAQALGACAMVASAMWGALDGIYYN